VVQAPRKNNAPTSPSFTQPKSVISLTPRSELPPKNIPLSEPFKMVRETQEETEEPTLDDEDGEFGQPEEGFDDAEEEEVPDLETEDDEAIDSNGDGIEQKPSLPRRQEAPKDQGSNSAGKN
jgi:hypothetical protein